MSDEYKQDLIAFAASVAETMKDRYNNFVGDNKVFDSGFQTGLSIAYQIFFDRLCLMNHGLSDKELSDIGLGEVITNINIK